MRANNEEKEKERDDDDEEEDDNDDDEEDHDLCFLLVFLPLFLLFLPSSFPVPLLSCGIHLVAITPSTR